MVKNVRQLAISYFFPLPSLKKREEEKKNEAAKPVLSHFFQSIESIFTNIQNSSYRGLQSVY